VTEAWDTLAVSWRNAVNRPGAMVPWSVPGGAVTPAVGAVEWTGGAGETDSVRIPLDSITVRQMVSGELHGVQVRSATGDRRLELSRLDLQVSIRPAGQPDTVLTELIFGGLRTFILNPDPPRDPGVLRLGGLAGARAALQLNLDQQVPTCPPPNTAPGCTTISLRQVTLDRASLVLRPAPVPAGFRPLTPSLLQARRLFEPELGPRAPVGGVLVAQNVPPERFAGAAGAAEVTMDLTGAVGGAMATAPHTLGIVLVSAIGSNDFGTAWFETSPTLRLIYTVPRAPRFP
jgi:hypothetical protein